MTGIGTEVCRLMEQMLPPSAVGPNGELGLCGTVENDRSIASKPDGPQGYSGRFRVQAAETSLRDGLMPPSLVEPLDIPGIRGSTGPNCTI